MKSPQTNLKRTRLSRDDKFVQVILSLPAVVSIAYGSYGIVTGKLHIGHLGLGAVYGGFMAIVQSVLLIAGGVAILMVLWGQKMVKDPDDS